jgi:hypothetical protein
MLKVTTKNINCTSHADDNNGDGVAMVVSVDMGVLLGGRAGVSRFRDNIYSEISRLTDHRLTCCHTPKCQSMLSSDSEQS